MTTTSSTRAVSSARSKLRAWLRHEAKGHDVRDNGIQDALEEAADYSQWSSSPAPHFIATTADPLLKTVASAYYYDRVWVGDRDQGGVVTFRVSVRQYHSAQVVAQAIQERLSSEEADGVVALSVNSDLSARLTMSEGEWQERAEELAIAFARAARLRLSVAHEVLRVELIKEPYNGVEEADVARTRAEVLLAAR